MNNTTTGLRIASQYATTMLERAALRWMNERGADYESGAAGVYKDLSYGGCASGMVGHLIYYRDTLRFYSRHRKDIAALLSDTLEMNGCTLAELFGDKWDASDPLAMETQNRNLLAWFGFEEAARNVAQRAGLED